MMKTSDKPMQKTRNLKKSPNLSPCCKAQIWATTKYKGTNYWVCDKCRKPCGILTKDRVKKTPTNKSKLKGNQANKLGGFLATLDGKSSTSIPKPEKWEKQFDKLFIRDDGLMDKYGWGEGGEDTTGNLIKSFIREHLKEAKEEGKEEAYKNVGSWYPMPEYKEMTMTKNIDGTGGIISGGCQVCGGKSVTVRGKHPHEPKREICPTCTREVLESIYSNCNNRQAAEERITGVKI